MTGYFTGKVEAGKVFKCNTCGKTPNVGDERFYEKKDDKWLGCTDLECFKQQGGSPDPASKSGGGKFQSNKHPIGNAVPIYELAEALLEAFYKKRESNAENTTAEERLPMEQEAIFIESLMRTLSGNFKP